LLSLQHGPLASDLWPVGMPTCCLMGDGFPERRTPGSPARRAKGIGMPARLALAALIALAGSALAAEPFPDHPITLIVPYAAGGSSDVLARLLELELPQREIRTFGSGEGFHTELRFIISQAYSR
jgi:hypothetical protein